MNRFLKGWGLAPGLLYGFGFAFGGKVAKKRTLSHEI
jgi:hypothetical protein